MSNMAPFFSVIIPTYNRANMIGEAIDSVLRQTLQDFELLVIDDGSQDNTGKALEIYRDKIQYHYKENGGGSNARNFAIKRATGKFIAFLDSDDLWLPTRLAELKNYLDNNQEYSAVITDVEKIDEVTGKTIGYVCYEKDWPSAENLLPYAIEYPIGRFSNMTVKREVILELGELDEMLKTAEDIDYFLRIATCYKIGLVAKPLLKYRKSADSLSHKICTGNKQLVIDKFKKNNLKLAQKYKDVINKRIAEIHNSDAEDLLYHRYVKESRKRLIDSMKSHITIKSLLLYFKSIIIQMLAILNKKYKDKGKIDE